MGSSTTPTLYITRYVTRVVGYITKFVMYTTKVIDGEEVLVPHVVKVITSYASPAILKVRPRARPIHQQRARVSTIEEVKKRLVRSSAT